MSSSFSSSAKLLLLLATVAGAARITGTVTDSSGQVLEGVSVRLADSSTGTSCDTMGSFVLDLPDLSGQLIFSHIGYEEKRLNLTEGDQPLHIVLETALLVAPAVTVTGGRSAGDRPLSFTNLDSDELARRDQGQDLSRLLEGTPGLVTMSYSGTQVGYNEIRLRGFDQKRVEVLVNGIPLNDPEDHYVYWVDLPDMGSSLEDVQIQRGAGGSPYGGSNFGGSVNMLTSLGDTPGGNHQLSLGSHGTRRASFSLSSGLIDGHWQLEGRLGRITTDGYREETGVDMWSYYLASRLLLGKASLRLNHYDGHEVSHVAWDGVEDSYLFSLNGYEKNRRANSYAIHNNSIDDFKQPHTELFLSTPLPDASELELTLYHVSGEGFYETLKTGVDPLDYGLELDGSPDIVNRRWIEKDQIGLTASNLRELGFGQLEFGLSGYTYKADHFGRVIQSDPMPVSGLDGASYYLHKTEKQKAGAWLRLQIPLGTFDLEGGMALQYSRYALRQLPRGSFTPDLLNRFEDEHTFVNPSIGLNWQPNRAWRVYTQLAFTQREPSRSEYWNAWQGPDDLGVSPMFADSRMLADGSLEWSNPLVDPESMIDLELGASWSSSRARLSANLYWMELRDEIVNYGGVDEESPVKGNAPRSHHAGIELEGLWKLLDRASLGGNLALSQNRIDELVIFEEHYAADWSTSTVPRDFSGNPHALSPEILLNLWLDWQFGPLHLRPGLQHTGEQYLDNSGDDNYLNLDPALIDPAWLMADGSPVASKKLDAYTLMSLEARLELKTLTGLDLELRLQLENLLDSEYETGGYFNEWTDLNGDWLYEPQRALYPGAPRSWMLTMDWRF